jgi:hypothetical protein
VVKSRKEFLDALERIRKGFSDRPEALRHIERIGIGSAPAALVDLKDPKRVEDAIDSVTIASVLASWPEVDLGACFQLQANKDLRPATVNSPLAAGLPPLMFPVFQPSSVEYRAFTKSRTHAVALGFNPSAQREAVIKAENPFEDTVELQGIDVLGRKTRLLTFSPRRTPRHLRHGFGRLFRRRAARRRRRVAGAALLPAGVPASEVHPGRRPFRRHGLPPQCHGGVLPNRGAHASHRNRMAFPQLRRIDQRALGRRHLQFQAGTYFASLDRYGNEWTADGKPYANAPRPEIDWTQSGWMLAMEYGLRIGSGEMLFGAEMQGQSESFLKGMGGSIKARSERLSLAYAWTLLSR